MSSPFGKHSLKRPFPKAPRLRQFHLRLFAKVGEEGKNRTSPQASCQDPCSLRTPCPCRERLKSTARYSMPPRSHCFLRPLLSEAACPRSSSSNRRFSPRLVLQMRNLDFLSVNAVKQTPPFLPRTASASQWPVCSLFSALTGLCPMLQSISKEFPKTSRFRQSHHLCPFRVSSCPYDEAS